MIYLFFVAAGLLLFLVLAVDHVMNRFEHTSSSRRVLVLEAAAAVVIGIFLVYSLVSLESVVWNIAVGVLVGAALFIATAFITVELWRRRKLRLFNEQIGELRHEASELRQEIERLNWKERDYGQKRSRVEGKNRDRLTEQAEIRRKLARWEQGGGLARLRTVKVRDWRREYEQLSATELETKRREIAAELENASGDEREQLQAQLYVIELTRLDKNLSGPNQELSELEADLSQLGEQRRQIEQKLASIERELEEWREQKREFLENKVRLD